MSRLSRVIDRNWGVHAAAKTLASCTESQSTAVAALAQLFTRRQFGRASHIEIGSLCSKAARAHNQHEHARVQPLSTNRATVSPPAGADQPFIAARFACLGIGDGVLQRARAGLEGSKMDQPLDRRAAGHLAAAALAYRAKPALALTPPLTLDATTSPYKRRRARARASSRGDG